VGGWGEGWGGFGVVWGGFVVGVVGVWCGWGVGGGGVFFVGLAENGKEEIGQVQWNRRQPAQCEEMLERREGFFAIRLLQRKVGRGL